MSIMMEVSLEKNLISDIMEPDFTNGSRIMAIRPDIRFFAATVIMVNIEIMEFVLIK